MVQRKSAHVGRITAKDSWTKASRTLWVLWDNRKLKVNRSLLRRSPDNLEKMAGSKVATASYVMGAL